MSLLRIVLSFLLLCFFNEGSMLAQDRPQNIAAATSYVTDSAHVLSGATQQKLEQVLQKFTQDSGVETAVVILPRFLIEGTIEDNAQYIFDTWGIGSKQKDTGVLLLFSMQERKVRVLVGYGIEPFLTDATAGAIIRDVIVPKMRQGDIDGAVVNGTHAIMQTLSKNKEELFNPHAQKNAQVQEEMSDARMLLWILAVLSMFLLSNSRKNAMQKSPFFKKSSSPLLFFCFFLLLNLLFFNVMLNALISLFAYFAQNSSGGSGPPGRGPNIFGGGGFWPKGGGSGGFGGFGGGRSGGGGASGGW